MSLRELVEQHESNFNTGNLDADREIVSEDVEIEAPGAALKGIEAHLAFVAAWKSAFPDGTLTADLSAEQGDLVIAEGVFRGTHTGDLVGASGTIPPTGRRVNVKFCDLYRIREGRIYEHRVYFDQVDFLTQLGVLPAQ